MGEVGIAVGMALFSCLNEANHWDEHTEIPEPAGEHVRSFTSENDCCRSDCEQESDRENDFPNCQGVIWMRIENRETCRPQCVPDVNHVTRDRVLHSPEERQRRDRTSSAFLQEKCDDTGARGENEQGNLFQEEALYYAPLITGLSDFGFSLC